MIPAIDPNRRFIIPNYNPIYGFPRSGVFNSLPSAIRMSATQEQQIQAHEYSLLGTDDFEQLSQFFGESKEEMSLVVYKNEDTKKQDTPPSTPVFKNFCETIKEYWPFKVEKKRKSPFEFRPPLDCTIYENALMSMSLTEEEARDREVLEDRYIRSCRNQKKYIERVREINHPFLKNFEKIHYETQIAYRTIVERLHSEV